MYVGVIYILRVGGLGVWYECLCNVLVFVS
jgi:hypothetical protein